MTEKEIVQALRRLRVETGSLACVGCGWEHNCGTHGCAILRQATDLIERLTAENAALREKRLWQPVLAGGPEREGCYLVSVRHWLDGAPVVREAFWNGVDWLSCERRHEITPRVTHWMALPAVPEEGGKA
nr:MAG TPA: Protein of unknown function (DUF551) [Caudoviricetes sp.]